MQQLYFISRTNILFKIKNVFIEIFEITDNNLKIKISWNFEIGLIYLWKYSEYFEILGMRRIHHTTLIYIGI